MLMDKQKQLAESQDRKEKLKKEELAWRKDINEIFGEKVGQRFLIKLVKWSSIFSANVSENANGLLIQEARKSMYLSLIRPYLKKEIKVIVENPEESETVERI